MLNVSIEVSGHSHSDIEDALELILAQLKQGYTEGRDSNSTGSYNFSESGRSIEYYRIKKNGKLGKKRYQNFFEAEEAKKKDDVIMGYDEYNCAVERE